MLSKTKPAILVFPASNCDRDMQQVLQNQYDLEPVMLWHSESKIPKSITHVILPGGFSFGDYLRAGVLASLSPIMKSVINFAKLGGPILGVCNGFQILCEAKLLPGTLLRNLHGRFVCKTVKTDFFGLDGEQASPDELVLHVAHGEGRYYAPKNTLDELIKNQNIILKYQHDINGSAHNIAGIACGPYKNIIGMMPHPERTTQNKKILHKFLFG